MRFLGVVCWFFAAVSGWTQQFPLDEFQTLRHQAGLSSLLWDEDLAKTCQVRSKELSASGQLSHRNENGQGPGNQLMAEGFPPGVYGEVLGAGKDPLEVWKAWLSSPTHRLVLVDPQWKSWGWGASKMVESTVWVVRFRNP